MSEVEKAASADEDDITEGISEGYISTIDEILKNLRNKKPDDITATEILIAFLASYQSLLSQKLSRRQPYTDGDSENKVFDLLEVVSEKNAWKKWNKAVKLLSTADITDKNGDKILGSELAEVMKQTGDMYIGLHQA